MKTSLKTCGANRSFPNYRHSPLIVRRLTPVVAVPRSHMLSGTRAVRRNITRDEKQLHAWKAHQNRVVIETTGQQYVPVPLQFKG